MFRVILIALVLVSCSEFAEPKFSDDEIREHAQQKASSIVREYYTNFNLFSLSTEVVNSFFESESVINIEVKVSYEWHTKEYSSTAGGYIPRIGWIGGLVDKQFKGDRTHALKFKVIREVESIEKTIRYQNTSPPFEAPKAFG